MQDKKQEIVPHSCEKINNQIASVLDKLNAMESMLTERKKSSTKEQARSSDLKDLFAALAKAQSIMPSVTGKKENPYFKERYIDLGDMITASRPALTKNGLCVIQQILPNDDGQMILHTILSHESGQWIESQVRIIPPKNDVRTMDSYITYLRRCTYSALVGIVGADDDDDGEYASATSRDTFAKGTALNTKYNPKENKLETVTKEQLEELEYELGGDEHHDIAEMVLDGLKIQNLADMPKEKFLTSVNRIRKIKNIRDGK